MARHLGVAAVHPQRGWDALRRLGWSLQSPRPRHPRAAAPEERAALKRKIAAAVARARGARPGRPVEVWAGDEHRLGLKPVRRRVWAPMGARPIGLGHHRYEWLHVTAFVQPSSGEAVWYLSTGLSKPLFEALDRKSVV